ncbi:MAG: hypothetical protein ACLGHX_03190 [Acidimicrobiia bacterium]
MKKFKAVIFVGLILAVIAGALPAAAKGKPARDGGGSGGWIVLDQPSPSHGDTVTFTVSDENSYVVLKCYQGGELVMQQTHGMFESYPWDAVYTLASPSWTSGSATCAAEAGTYARNGRFRAYASITFGVAA